VAKERLKSPRARLFVALDLPEHVREGLAEWQRRELVDGALRPSRSETLHMTLAFLGYHPERAIVEIAEAAIGFPAEAPRVRLLPDPVPVPGRRPRLFAIDTDSDDSVALQAEVERRLVEARFYEPEKHDFWPHLTVARVRPERRRGDDRRRRRRGPPMRVESPPRPLPDELLEPFLGVRITLYRSHLRPTGAEYESVAQLELPPSGGGKAS
jgi:RNA 2',3'-cyclic 3'-phosphodiesterase